MKTKASPSQMKRSARERFQSTGYINALLFDSPQWAGVLTELAKELELVPVVVTVADTTATVYTTKETARTVRSVQG